MVWPPPGRTHGLRCALAQPLTAPQRHPLGVAGRVFLPRLDPSGPYGAPPDPGPSLMVWPSPGRTLAFRCALAQPLSAPPRHPSGTTGRPFGLHCVFAGLRSVAHGLASPWSDPWTPLRSGPASHCAPTPSIGRRRARFSRAWTRHGRAAFRRTPVRRLWSGLPLVGPLLSAALWPSLSLRPHATHRASLGAHSGCAASSPDFGPSLMVWPSPG